MILVLINDTGEFTLFQTEKRLSLALKDRRFVDIVWGRA